MTKELIEIIRQSLIPFVKKELLDINYEGLGKSDAEEFEKDLNEILDLAIKALEQQPSDDVMAIHTQGLDEGIRCAMCTNSMKSDRGCDGGCVVDEDMYKKVMETINNQMVSQPTSEDCVSRQAVKKGMIKYGFRAPDMTVTEFIEDELPPVIPTHGTCKECKYSSVHTISLDKIDEIRVCRIQFSKQIKDDYYCANYEKRGSENEVN